jgi:endoglucanase
VSPLQRLYSPRVLSNGLPRLAVDGRQIVNAASRQRVLLRGVNRSGLEYAEPDARGFLESAGISESEIAHVVRDWKANIIRLPFNQDWALNGRGSLSAAAYLGAIDQVIFWASRAGAYTVLDLQWLDAENLHGLNADGTYNRVPSLPTTDSIAVWTLLARRYRAEPAVLFDVFNEPHDPMRDDTGALEGIREDGTTFPLKRRRVAMTEWQPWARHLVQAIRDPHPGSLIFVSGVRWAYDLRGMPLTIGAGSREVFPNLVYGTHVYPWGGSTLSWSEAFGHLSRSAPVFVLEWGGGTPHVGWGETFVRYARKLGIGWTAWSWSDRPRLVVDAQAQRYEPTDFGRLVRRSLSDVA